MKTIKQIVAAAILVIAVSAGANAQGWSQEKHAIYSLGAGVSQSVFLPARYYNIAYRGSQSFGLNVSGEYPVHQYVGLGWQTGMNFYDRGRYYNPDDELYYYTTVIGIPMGFKANFHILEAVGAASSDHADLYAGLNIGGGPAFYDGPGQNVYGFLYGGPQVGFRYWFTRAAIFGEVGWGASIINIGVTF